MIRAEEDYELIRGTVGSPVLKSGVVEMLNDIRPVWRGKKLIERVKVLLPVDPSSACQRLFNAAIHDLKQKIIILGVDLAKEVAGNYRLPNITKEDDILDYNVSKTIDLAYRLGLLSRAEWRRIHRCYEIRRDLEHEDNEYEAVLEDCFYIFKSAIDIVLSKDPIELLKVTDAKDLVEASSNLVVSEEFLENFKNAPKLRQIEITELLVSYAFDDRKPEIVRENSIELLRHLLPLTQTTVTIEIAGKIEDRMPAGAIDMKTAKISSACGAIAYFKKVRLKDFYSSLNEELYAARSDWRSQTSICAKIEDIGGITHCPKELYDKMLKWLVLFFIGEPAYGPGSSYRNVFFSNNAAPIIKRIISFDSESVGPSLEKLRTDKDVAYQIRDTYVLRRFEALLDVVEIE